MAIPLPGGNDENYNDADIQESVLDLILHSLLKSCGRQPAYPGGGGRKSPIITVYGGADSAYHKDSKRSGLIFDGRNAIITGGSSGLGRALAHRLAERGANLALIARDRARLEATRQELLLAVGPDLQVSTYSCDVVDYAEVEKTMATIAGEIGPLQLLINSAGILREGYFEQLSPQTFHEVIGINYFGTLNCIKAILPYFQQQGKGWVVNISSIGGRFGVFGYSAYCSSKYAVLGLSDSLRAELKPQGIRVQVVCPPEFESPMVDELNKCRTPENRRLAHTMPVLNAEIVADAVMAGLESKRYLIIPDRISRFLDLSNRLLPGMGRWITDTQIKIARRASGKQAR